MLHEDYILRKSLCYLSEGKNENENYTVYPSPMLQDNPISCFTFAKILCSLGTKKYKQSQIKEQKIIFPLQISQSLIFINNIKKWEAF